MRIIVAPCSAEYTGRLTAHLPKAKRVLLVKGDSSVLIFSELGSYKPLNWMAAPCVLNERWLDGSREDGAIAILEAHATKSSDRLVVLLYEIDSDESYDLGIDPGLVKDGVEDQLQHYLAEQIEREGTEDRVVLHGFLPEEDKNRVLSSCHLHVTASDDSFNSFGGHLDKGIVQNMVEVYIRPHADKIDRVPYQYWFFMDI